MTKKYRLLFITLVIVSCNNNSNNKVVIGEREYPSDTATVDYPQPKTIQPKSDRAFGYDSSLLHINDKDATGAVAKRQLLYMSIDSTYYAINEIETIKNDMAAQSSVALSVTERNLKSKALLQLNIVQNNLARQVDAAILVNLKQHTRELASVNNAIADNTTHLKDVAIQVTKAAAIMSRLTNVLALCVSKGVIKPPTPIRGSAAEIKASVK
jgi:hypothetical protein